MESSGALKIAVLGSAMAREDSPEARKAAKVGELLAQQGAVLLTGGCPGLPHAAVRGAKSYGGLSVAVSPAMNRHEHVTVYSYPLDSDIVLFTGMGAKGRNVILVRSADACVFIGGGMGTLNEFTIAVDDLGPDAAIGVLTGTGGLSDEFSRLVSMTNKPPRAYIVAERDPERLLEAMVTHVSRRAGKNP